jgi:D-alanyl-lipoteichoic acid acyltransferase DltB (MBOAT superfamily)
VGSELLELLVHRPGETLLFDSGLFLALFLLLLAALAAVHDRPALRIPLLLAFSLYFAWRAGGWTVLYLLLAALLHHALGHLIHREDRRGRRRALLGAGVALDLGLLVLFRYRGLPWVGGGEGPPGPVAVLGISFVSFRLISYLADVHRGTLLPAQRFAPFLLWVAFFPLLPAGPIQRAEGFLPQVGLRQGPDREDQRRALWLVSAGLFKKGVLADLLAADLVDRVFDSPRLYGGLENLLAVYGYTLQIYADFSGYTDLALGIGLLVGFRLTGNFDHPYRATSPTDFWRRWHISLSTWLRDYLYIPLGGSRKGTLRTYANLMATMLLGGLWHGASLTFALWGFWHGLALWADKTVRNLIPGPAGRGGRILGAVATFHAVAFGWILFRSPDLGTAGAVLARIGEGFALPGGAWFAAWWPILGLLAGGYTLHFLPRRWLDRGREAVTNLPLPAQSAVLALAIWAVVQVRSAEIRPYVYLGF